MKTEKQKLEIIEARANELFSDRSDTFHKGAICFAAKHMGTKLKIVADFLGVGAAFATQASKYFEEHSTYDQVKDLVMESTIKYFGK